MNTYTAGDLLTLSVAFTNNAGVPMAPTTVTLRVQTPDYVITDLSGTIVPGTTGNYSALFSAVQVGVHQYEWIGTGAVQVTVVDLFLVNQAQF